MILRAPMAFGAAALLTTSLYYGMHLLITTDDVSVWTEAAPKVIDTRIPEREIAPPEQRARPQKPEIVPQPLIETPDFVVAKPGDYVVPPIDVKPTSKPNGKELFKIDRNAQPIMRIEPNFKNITQFESITLSFDVDRSGAVIKDSISVLETTSSRLVREAKRTVARWKYRPKVEDGSAVVQRGVYVKFSVQPPE